MTVKDRIKAYCKEENITIAAFEESVGVSNGYVNSISKSIGIDKINTIVEKYSNIDIEWLLTGRGSMLKSKRASNSSPSCEESTPPSKDTNNITNKQDITGKRNTLVDPFLILIRERDATIKEQAEEIGQLKEQVRQLTIEKERLAAYAQASPTANVG